ncbi:MAG: choice-of-anchor D domain-containing protein [Chloroflexota bacterium]
MAGRPGRQARPLSLVAAAGLAVVVAGSALAGAAPPLPALPAAPAALPPGSVETPGRNELVSTPQRGEGGFQTQPPTIRGASVQDIFAAPTISGGGRYVVFLQRDSLKLGNELALRDRTTKKTTVLAEGSLAGLLDQPTISADGRWIAYVRYAVAGAVAGPVVFLMDRQTGVPQPLDPPGRYRNPTQPALSGDGQFVVMRAFGLEGTGILLYDRINGGWEEISVDIENQPVSAFSGANPAQPAISADGRFVAFTARSGSAVFVGAPKGNAFRQVYLRDRVTPSTVMLSVNTDGQAGGNDSLNPAINADGSVVAFPSAADDLVAGDANQQTDVFAWAAASGRIELVSLATDGSPSNGPSGYPAVTADGSTVSFASGASSLVPGDTTSSQASPTTGLVGAGLLLVAGDIFARDRGTGRTTRLSMARGNVEEANGISTFPSISATGRFIAFTSAASNLIAKDANGQTPDVFVRERPPRVEAAPNPVDFGSAPLGSLGTTRPATIRSTGITPARIGAISIGGANASDFVVAANPCSDRTLIPGATCELQVLFIGTARGDRAATLLIANDAGAAVVLRLVGAVGIAKLTVEPKSGPPGLVVIATGAGFPPNAPVDLRWSVGISATPLVPVVSDATGSFTAQVLIIPRDRVGKRNLRAVASVPGLDVDPVTAGFLVVTSTAGPPISGLVQVFAVTPGEPIILRR